MLPYIVAILLVIGVVLAVRLFMKRAAAQRAAHDARVRTMAQATIAAMKKKQSLQNVATAAPSGRGAAEGSGTPIREERECPYCAELILKKARVCKHCGRDVEPYSQSV